MHIVSFQLDEMVADFMTTKFGATFDPDKISIQNGHEAIALQARTKDILSDLHIPTGRINMLSMSGTRPYTICSPYSKMTLYQNRRLDQLFRMYFRQELAWYLLTSPHSLLKDKIAAFCKDYNLSPKKAPDNIFALYKYKRKKLITELE